MSGISRLTYEERINKQIEEHICNHIKKYKCDYVIYPYGKRGAEAKRILNENGVSEKYIVDNRKCAEAPDIKSVAYLKEDYKKDKGFMILLAADFVNKHELYQQIADFAGTDRIIDVCSPSMFYNLQLYEEYEERMNKQIEECICHHIKKHKCDYVIYPYGKRGAEGKRILNENGVSEKYIVDHRRCAEAPDVKSVAYLREDYRKDKGFMILLLADYANKDNLELYQQIADFAETDRIIDVCSPSMFYNPQLFLEPPYLDRDIRHSAVECIGREIYRNNITGAVAEAGVYKGHTAMHINYLFPDRKLYLFDTFAGFHEEDQRADDDRGRYNLKIDYSDTTEAMVLGKMRFPQNCIIKKGWFPQTAEDVKETFAFVRLDMDLYEPILAGLRFFYPKMSGGGVYCSP